jgi:hypothetical protein
MEVSIVAVVEYHSHHRSNEYLLAKSQNCSKLPPMATGLVAALTSENCFAAGIDGIGIVEIDLTAYFLSLDNENIDSAIASDLNSVEAVVMEERLLSMGSSDQLIHNRTKWMKRKKSWWRPVLKLWSCSALLPSEALPSVPIAADLKVLLGQTIRETYPEQDSISG